MDTAYILILATFGFFLLCIIIYILMPNKKKKAEDKKNNSPMDKSKPKGEKHKWFSGVGNRKPRVHKVDIKKDKERHNKKKSSVVGEKTITALYPSESEVKKEPEVVESKISVKDNRTQLEKRVEVEQMLKTMGSHASYDTVEKMYPQRQQNIIRSYADELMASLPRTNSMNTRDYSSYDSRLTPSVSVGGDNSTINNNNVNTGRSTFEELSQLIANPMTREEYATRLRERNYNNGQGSEVSSDEEPSDETIKNMIIGEALARPKSKHKANYFF
ncbi:MAG: hypothetical protein RR334_02385 [Clostridia bacterium]